MKSAIGIDLGATNARVGLVTFDGNIKYAEPEKVQRNEFDELKDLRKNILNSGYNAIMYFIDLKFLI